jgi:hypothetical protein
VHDPLPVRVGEPAGHLRADARDIAGGERAPGVHAIRQRLRQEVHHEVWGPGGDAVERLGQAPDGEDRDDVRVAELGCGHRLPPEAVDHLGVGGELGAEDLHGDVEFQVGVDGVVHAREAADAHRAHHAVAAEQAPGDVGVGAVGRGGYRRVGQRRNGEGRARRGRGRRLVTPGRRG